MVIRPRSQHNISRKDIDPDALKVLYRLADAGYKAYLVGGGVRDLLLGLKPKDFDVGTDAHPREIKRLFRNCFLIGRRFRLAHVVFGRKVIETSTFRRQPPPADDEEGPGELYQTSDNTFGTPEEDARRRDFTVNGLFYDIKTFSVIDYVGGLRDLDRRVLRSIGDPDIRFREDPVRMLRAARLSARLGLTMDSGVRRAIRRHASGIDKAAVPRVLEEIFKLFGFAAAAPAFRQLWETGLLAVLMPEIEAHIDASGGERAPFWRYLRGLDELARRQEAEPANGLRLAALYCPLFLAQAAGAPQRDGGPRSRWFRQAAEDVLQPFISRFHPPKATVFHALHLLETQPRLEAPPSPGRRGRPGRPEFLADALALARLRLDAEEKPVLVLEAWARRLPPAESRSLPATAEESGGASRRRHGRRRGGRRRRPQGSPQDDFNAGTPAAGAPLPRPSRASRDKENAGAAAASPTGQAPARPARHEPPSLEASPVS